MDFYQIWKPLLDHGSSERRKTECEQLWSTFTDAQQQQIYDAICYKLQHNLFVHFDPFRAIRENSWMAKPAEPQWCTGGEKGLDLVQVKYGDRIKICTRATMELFGLEWVRDWNS